MRHTLDSIGILFACLGIFLAVNPVAAQTYSVVRIIQTNSAGTNAQLIDPTTHEIVAVIDFVPQAHAAVDHPDGYYYYFANEADNTVDIIDTKTLRTVGHIPLTARPNKLAINDRLRKLYVGIRSAPYVDVIDIDTHEVIKTISVNDGVHNVYITDDYQHVIIGLGAAPPTEDDPAIQVIDANTDEVVWGVPLEGHRVRPMAIESNDDGTPNRLFGQATRLNGFYVVDWDERKAVDFISPPPVPVSRQNFDGIQDGTGHGLIVLPDKSSLWYASRLDSRVYVWSLPDLEFQGGIDVGPSPQWLTATPDSRIVYVSVVGTMETLALDVETREIVARIPVGHAPKRNSTHVIPADRVENVQVVND